MQGCGSSTSSSASNVFSNVVIIQNDAVVQEIWDSAQKLTCLQRTQRLSKSLSVAPLTVNTLEFSAQDVRDDAVDVENPCRPSSGDTLLPKITRPVPVPAPAPTLPPSEYLPPRPSSNPAPVVPTPEPTPLPSEYLPPSPSTTAVPAAQNPQSNSLPSEYLPPNPSTTAVPAVLNSQSTPLPSEYLPPSNPSTTAVPAVRNPQSTPLPSEYLPPSNPSNPDCRYNSKDPNCLSTPNTIPTDPTSYPTVPTTNPTVPSTNPTIPDYSTVPESSGDPRLCPPGSNSPQCVIAGSSNAVTVTKNAMEKPAAESWKGNSAFHAFHKFHFDRGDGRRGRKVKRSMPVASVLTVDPSVDFVQPRQYFVSRSDRFCFDHRSFAISAVLMGVTLMALIAAVVFLLFNYLRVRRQLEKNQSR